LYKSFNSIVVKDGIVLAVKIVPTAVCPASWASPGVVEVETLTALLKA
jgi:hypothetical protein